MLRSFSSACGSSAILSSRRLISTRVSAISPALQKLNSTQIRSESSHAISNPELANIEKRWEQMPPEEQAQLWMALRDRMKSDWHDMTFQERKAAYYIAFGPHGPRADLLDTKEKWRIVRIVIGGVAISTAVWFAIRSQRREAPSTMNKEWQEATNAYMKENDIEPITGVSSENYVGVGQVQSPPKKKE